MKKLLLYGFTVALLCAFSSSETLWTQDKMHSQLNFSATHFGLSQVEGRFQSFTITMKSEKADLTDAQIEMSADIKSLNTEVAMRDNDLRSSNWFDAEKYPTLTFKSTSFSKLNGKLYLLKGDLTIHGITKKVAFTASLNGWAVTKTKKNTAGFTLKGKLLRSDYAIGDTALLTGVSDEILIWTNFEMGKD